MKLWKNIKKHIKRYWAPTAIVGFFGLSVTGQMWQNKKIEAQKEKMRLEQIKQDSLNAEMSKIKSPVLKIIYQNDTLETSGSALYLYYAGKITRYFVEKDNRYKLQLPYLAHEEWHHHNHDAGFRYKYYYTPTDYYKLCMHNEISANMAAILTARYEYLAAPTKAKKREIVNRYKNTYMKFYFEKVAKGQIKPESKDPKDIEKERALIANGTLNMWLEKFAAHYRPSFLAMLQTYVGNVGLVSDSKKNYRYIMNHMYTIGGVNFSEYFKKDIELKEDKVLLAEQLPKIRFMKAGGVEIMNIVNQNYRLMEQVGMDKQTEIFQNLLISSQLKYMLRNKTADELVANPQLVNLCYRKIMNKVYTDNSFSEVAKAFPLLSINRMNLTVKDANFVSTAKQMYQYQGVDLTAMITDFSPNNVPVKTTTDQFFENSQTDGFAYLFPQMSAQMEKSLQTKRWAKHPTPAEPKPKTKPRVSEPMYVRLPNLREPILLHATPQDEAQIFAALREFEAIPPVFKNCDTKAQEQYLKEHEHYMDSLRNFQATGSFDIKQFVKRDSRTSNK
ncbi:MAG: hypothetical protein IKR92_03635 [Alphaproteobacteria bacterium]|nr:hypothetical protein [Alphaproteobacteria bacterium]